MGLSSRLLLLSAHDVVHRLSEVDFNRLYSAPSAWRVAELSGQRIRWASLVVELLDRRPLRVVHRSFAFMHFDAAGRLDVQLLGREQVARMEVALAPTPGHAATGNVTQASSHFAARGGSWKPDAALLARLDAAAIGPTSCPRIRLGS